MAHAFRTDRSILGAVQRTPQGGIRVPATVTRSGVLTYLQPDGSKRREYRPASEVFSVEHLASLRGAPVTDLHPGSGRVDSKTWRSLSVGHAGETPAQEGDHVLTDLYIQDSGSIDLIESGERSEVSLGYDTDLVLGKGVSPEGEEYDATQTNLRVNHVALVPKGRAGSARLRLDGDEEISECASLVSMPLSPEVQARLDALESENKRLIAEQLASRKLALRAVLKTHKVSARADASPEEMMTDAIKKIAPGVDIDGASPDFLAGAFAVAIAMALDIVPAPEPDAATPPPAPDASGGDAALARADAVDARRAPAAPRDLSPSADELARTRMIARRAGRKD